MQRATHIIRSETLGRRLASAKSLAKSLAKIPTKSLAETLSETLGEIFGETLGETFRARQAFPQSVGSDYMHGSPQDSLRDSCFYAGAMNERSVTLYFSRVEKIRLYLPKLRVTNTKIYAVTQKRLEISSGNLVH